MGNRLRIRHLIPDSKWRVYTQGGKKASPVKQTGKKKESLWGIVGIEDVCLVSRGAIRKKQMGPDK